MYVNFEYYRIFYYVAKYQNFTKAAQAIGGNQPNVTRAMNRLEDETHCKLFMRTNRGIKLTPEGEGLYTHVKAAMFQLETAEKELTAATNLSEGSVKIGASETALHVFLLERLRQFHTEHPSVRLCISNHSTPQAVKAVQDGDVDFAVVTTPVNLPSAELESIPLMPFKEILVGGRAFASMAEKPLNLAQLKNYPLISLGKDTMSYAFYRAMFGWHGLDYAPDTEAATTDQILPLVEYDLGLAFVPEPLAREAIEHGKIVPLALTESVPLRQVCLIHDRQHPLGEAARRLKALILEEAKLPPEVK